MNIQDAYNDWSTSYDRDENLTRDLDGIVTRRTLEDRHFESILETGCGTGKNTVFLAQIGARVCATDFSQGMMARAREKVQARNVRFLRVDLARPWPWRSSAFDLISCNLVLEHIQELSLVFSEASRALVPGGTFFLCELHPFKQYQGRKAVYSRAEGQTEIQAFTHHISDFMQAAFENRLDLLEFREWWHEEDADKPPRLASFIFAKPENADPM